MIYFARIPSTTGAIKIGRTNHVNNRMKALRTELLLATDAVSEKELHAAFSQDRIGGEWFRESPDLLALIESLRENSWEAAEAVRLKGSHSRFFAGIRRIACRRSWRAVMSYTGMSRARLQRSRPSLEALSALASALPAAECGPLILAHLLDECPAEARRDLILELRPHLEGSAGLSECEVEYGADVEVPDLSMDALFSALRFLAETRPEVLEWLQSSLPLIQ